MMKAVDQVYICPYTGLRSFTEEESLYFKGRDLQTDQIAALLEQNKFLMVTGASGEGKSSLIFGGLIPNVRAGFFKAKFTNWVIADFRPERSPVTQMAKALAKHFDAEQGTLETELRRGYSSLVDIYTNSSFYASDEELAELGDDKARSTRKRNASNLLIIVDQFEEFFTNPENYYNEAPSRDAQIVVNLILETSRIAIRRNLPVYVVCTMRSDYIGQCSAFRGLPEYIGFSQFFVPRLKRKDLKEVIEEPAVLSGNRIAQRLVERLVYDISDGVDQLPILQHALSRIWSAASNGAEEMDLVHYAMVGGMPAAELPDEDVGRFQQWLAGLPEYHQKLFQETGLNKVIENHANLLYETACDEYNRRYPDANIYPQEAKRIIAIAFSCLTKIDNSRAVRNRMTLREITSIINLPKLSPGVVGRVLTIFREEGNSFIRPFVTEDPATQDLAPEAVLDITHESLIRNWNKLNQWANKEFEYFTIFQDFQKQLHRWKHSGKNSGYLLPIGPLNYFENWYNTCKPNIGWIKRYEDASLSPEQAAASAEMTLEDTKAFLAKSARKEMISRAFMKYGPRKIMAGLALLAMLALTGFYWTDAARKRNGRVIEQVRAEAFKLLVKPEVSLREKAIYLLTEERYRPGNLISLLNQLDMRDRVMIGNEVYKQILYIDKLKELALKSSVVNLLVDDLERMQQKEKPDWLITEYNKLVVLMAEDQYYNPKGIASDRLAAVIGRNIGVVKVFLRDTSLVQPLVATQLNTAIQFWLSLGKPSAALVDEVVNLLVPEGHFPSGPAWRNYYPKGGLEVNGRMPVLFNGGLHTVASLFAAKGDTAGMLQCFRAQIDNNQRDYFELARVLNNHSNIIAYLYQYRHRDKVPFLIDWLTRNTRDNPPLTLFRNVVMRGGYISHFYTINIDLNFHRSTRGYLYPNIFLMDREAYGQLLQDYEDAIRKVGDPAERNFLMAMQSKRKAMFFHKYWYDRRMEPNTQLLDLWLQEAVMYYKATDSAFLSGKQSSTLVYNGDGFRTADVNRKSLFLYPDYRDGWFSWPYHSDYFFLCMHRKNLLNELYQQPEDLQAIHFWIAKAFEWKVALPSESYSNQFPLPDSTLQLLVNWIDKHPQGASFDQNLARLVLSANAYLRGDTTRGHMHYQRIRMDRLAASLNRYEYLEKGFIRNMINQLAAELARIGKDSEATTLIDKFDTPNDQVQGYFTAAEKLFRDHASPKTFAYLDSAYRVAQKLDYSVPIDGLIDPRYFQIQLLSEIGGSAFNKEVDAIMKGIPPNWQSLGASLRVLGQAYEGNYYKAYTTIPSSLTETEDLICRQLILTEACRARERKGTVEDTWKKMDRYVDWQLNYNDYYPN
jgi:hypothetical protein